MRLTIDIGDGLGETDCTSLLDAEHPPTITRKLNVPAEMEASLLNSTAAAQVKSGVRVRLYKADGSLWFSGIAKSDPSLEYAGRAFGKPVGRLRLVCEGEQALLDRKMLSERDSMGGRTAGQVVRELTAELQPEIDISAVEDVADAGVLAFGTGARWSSVVKMIADHARGVISVSDGKLAFRPCGRIARTLSENDADFTPKALQVATTGPAVNDLTVVGDTEPNLYVRDYFTGTGKSPTFALSHLPHRRTSLVLEDAFLGDTLDGNKWLNDAPDALSFSSSGVSCGGAVELRYRDPIELGGFVLLEQKAVAYASGTGIIGGLYCGGRSAEACVAGVMVSSGLVQPVIGGAVYKPVTQLSVGKRYDFETRLYHPEPIRAGQVYSSSRSNGASALRAQVWQGTSRVVLTMRPSDADNLGSQQVVLFDGELQDLPAFGEYLPMWGLDFRCTLGYMSARSDGAMWVRTALAGGAWRSRVVGDLSDGSECTVTTSPELRFATKAIPADGEQIELAYRSRGRACARVVDADAIERMKSAQDDGVRSGVCRVVSPAPRTSLDCEQAARALLEDLSLPRVEGTYKAWGRFLPEGAADVDPGEQWRIDAPSWKVGADAVVREVEIAFQDLSDDNALYTIALANDAAKPISIGVEFAASALSPVVRSEQGDDVSRPAGLPDARIVNWGDSTYAVDAGVEPDPGGGIEVRSEGDWGWDAAVARNLIGRFTTRSFQLPRSGSTQDFYLRQYDASTPPKYSAFSTLLHVEV